MISPEAMEAIKSRMLKASPVPWSINSIMVVNDRLSIYGEWDSSYDEANFDFICHARVDMENLVSDVERLHSTNRELLYSLKTKELELKVLRSQVEELKKRVV